MPKDVCVHPMTAAANVSHARNVNSASGICKISAKQMLDQESIFFLQPPTAKARCPAKANAIKNLHTQK